MTSKGPRAGNWTALITAALKAGFVDLAYCMFAIAVATTALGLTKDGKGAPYDMFHWVAAGVGALAFGFIAFEILELLLKKFRGASGAAS